MSTDTTTSVLVAGARTPMGRLLGSLSGLTAADVMSPRPKVIDPSARMSDAIERPDPDALVRQLRAGAVRGQGQHGGQRGTQQVPFESQHVSPHSIHGDAPGGPSSGMGRW